MREQGTGNRSKRISNLDEQKLIAIILNDEGRSFRFWESVVWESGDDAKSGYTSIYQGILPEGIEQVAVDLLSTGMAPKQVMRVIGLSLERTQQRQRDILF
jgi:hypothetical protein